MEFGLDDGQLQMQQTVARFCADRFPLHSIGRREGLPVDRGSWQEMATLGMLGLLAGDTGRGVDGLGVVEGVLMFEQLGSYLVTGLVLWTVAAAPLLDGADEGRLVVGGGDASVIEGGSVVVEHAADLDVLVVLDEEAVTVHRTDALPAPEPLEPLDPLTPVGRYWRLVAGEVVGGVGAAARLRVLGTVLSAALLVGLASRSLEVARGYALERRQFGVPIGSFQAVKHLLADMYVRGALAQSATYAAAAMAQDHGDDPTGAAAAAKLLAGEAAVANAGAAVQILGGMGFTWDMLPNYLLKRAWVLEQSFGEADHHALLIGSALLGAHQGATTR